MEDEKLIDYLVNFISESRNKRFDQVLEERTKYFSVAVEDVYQLHNTSAVIRSCDVFGIQEVNVIEEVNSKRIDREIAMGSQKWVDINRYQSSKDCIDEVKEQGYQIVATSPHKMGHELDQFDISKKSCFFFGSEQKGLSEVVMTNADTFLKIPMYGFTESLNLSVSAAIILQHVSNKLRQSHINWELSKKEKFDLKLKWIKNTLKSYDDIISRYELR